MAWERSFEARVLKIRENELKYQRLNYIIEVRTLYPLPSSFIDLTFEILPVDAFQQHLVCPMSHHVPLRSLSEPSSSLSGTRWQNVFDVVFTTGLFSFVEGTRRRCS